MGLKGAKAMSAFATQGERLKGFGRSWTRNVSLPIAGVSAAAVGFAVDFDRAMRNVNSIAQLPEPQFHRLEKSVLALSGPTAQSPKTLAEGLYDLVSSGFDAEEGLLVLRKSALAASAGLTTTEVATGAVAAVINAYGLRADSAGRISDQLFETVNRGVLTFEELASTVGDVLPFAAQLGVGLNQVGSAVSTMTKAGLSAPETMTRIKNVLVTLLKPGKDLSKTLKSMGVSGEQLVRKRGLQGALEAIVATTDGSKTAIAELFPNIRAMGGVLSLTGQNASRAKEDLKAFGDTAGATNKALKEQEKSVGFKAQRAWAKLQATLIKLGYKILPVLLPAAERLVNVVGSVLDTFIALPGPVQASIAGFLLLTGPVASGLGYFASGLGRILILATRLGRVGKSVGIFTTALRAGQGVGGAASMATSGLGQSAAIQTAKGFAYGLGPALAAAGIGNIVTSALSKDWKDAGFEAGGALAGGVAGFMAGGPLGAMIGVGIGSFGGELLSGLFSSAPKVSMMRRETEHLAGALSSYRDAALGLQGVEKRQQRAHGRHVRALQTERAASRALVRVLAKYGANSGHATRAQLRLSKAQRAVVRTAKAEARLHRLTGFRLKSYRIQSLHAVASIKQLLPAQRRRIKAMREEVNRGRTGMKFLNELEGLEKRVGKEKRKLTEIYGEAEIKAGKPWAKRLQSLTTLQAKYGTKGHALIEVQQKARAKLGELTQAGLKQSSMWTEAREELQRYTRQAERFAELEEGLSPARLGGNPGTRTTQGEHGHGAPGGPRTAPKHRNTSGSPQAGASRLLFSSPKRLSLNGDRVLTVEVTNNNNVNLDGKRVAESTARQSQRAANRS